MLNRRAFLATSAAALATPALAEDQNTYVVPEEYMPTQVRLQANLPPGQIHVDPNTFRLYLTQEDRTAIRYTVGVGRENLYEHGEFFVGAKKEWPSWTPTPDMIEGDPENYAKYADGMPGGPDNPVGARYSPNTWRSARPHSPVVTPALAQEMEASMTLCPSAAAAFNSARAVSAAAHQHRSHVSDRDKRSSCWGKTPWEPCSHAWLLDVDGNTANREKIHQRNQFSAH